MEIKVVVLFQGNHKCPCEFEVVRKFQVKIHVLISQGMLRKRKKNKTEFFLSVGNKITNKRKRPFFY